MKRLLALLILATPMLVNGGEPDQNRWINVSPGGPSAPLSDGPDARPEPDVFAALWCASDSVVYLLTPNDGSGALWRHENDRGGDRWIRLDRLPTELRPQTTTMLTWTRQGAFWLLDQLNQAWSYDRTERAWKRHETLETPTPQQVHFSETWYDEASDTLWNYGNQSLWTLAFDTMTWKRKASSPTPNGIETGTVVHRQGSTEAFLYGESAELWRLDMETLEWSVFKIGGPEGSPGPRTGQLMWISPSADGDVLHLYGGASSVDDGVWTIKVSADEAKWIAPSRASSRQPGPRDRFGSALCQFDEAVYVWGGRDETDTERWNDLWMYGARSSFIQEGWETWKSDQTFAAASLAAAMSTICFFVVFCYLIVSLIVCIRKGRSGGGGFDYGLHREEFT